MTPAQQWRAACCAIDTRGLKEDLGDFFATGSPNAIAYSKFAIAAGTGLALLGPNKYKVAGIAVAVLSGIVLVINQRHPAAQT